MTLNDAGELPDVSIKDLDSLFLAQETEYVKYNAYTKGDNPVILNEAEKADPDNRIPVPFARKIVLTVKGYMAKSGYITYKSESEEYQKHVNIEILKKNKETLKTAELLKDSISLGWGYELILLNDDLDIKQYRVVPNQGIMIYDQTLDQNEIAFVLRSEDDRVVNEKIVEYQLQTIYYKEKYVEYERLNRTGDWRKLDTKDHIFGMVPAVRYWPNIEGIPIYYPVLKMIDEHDKIISSGYANELERFANSYLIMLRKLNNVLDDEGLSDLDKMKELRLFDNLGAGGDVTNINQAIGF